MGDIAQATNHGEVAAFVVGEAVKVFEQVDGGLELVDDGIERRQRVARVAAAGLGMLSLSCPILRCLA